MQKILIPILLLILGVSPVDAQQSLQSRAERFRNDPNYICGESIHEDLETADKSAMNFLIGQISTNISSEFNRMWDSETKKDSASFNEKVQSIVRSFSCASLDNVGQIIINDGQNRKEAHVFRYIHRTDVEKSFKEREDKILDFIREAQQQEEKTQLNLAVKYYYWALVLLRSHPKGNNISCTDIDGSQKKAFLYLPVKIDQILSDIGVQIHQIDKENNMLNLSFTYKGQLLPNKIDYTYFNGFRTSKVCEAKDGRGTALFEMIPQGSFPVYLEYQYAREAETFDPELNVAIAAIGSQPFKNTAKTVTINSKSLTTQNARPQKTNTGKVTPASASGQPPMFDLRPETMASKQAVMVADTAGYLQIMNQVETAIRSKNLESVKSSFTEGGYQMFTSLLSYGDALIATKPSYRFLKFRDQVICRSIPIQFRFKTNNNKDFLEDVTFRFNDKQKIASVAFTLTKQTENELLTNDKQWDDNSKLTLLNFLEDYQTAYALKRIDYLEQIFSDSALIITGTELTKTALRPEMRNFINSKQVQYEKKSKQAYIEDLARSFRSKNYINLRFEDVNMSKKQGEEIYGVQLKQNYFSNSYNDQGYLTLLVDLKEENPMIHVRVWFKEKNEKLSSKTIITKPFGFESGEW